MRRWIFIVVLGVLGIASIVSLQNETAPTTAPRAAPSAKATPREPPPGPASERPTVNAGSTEPDEPSAPVNLRPAVPPVEVGDNRAFSRMYFDAAQRCVKQVLIWNTIELRLLTDVRLVQADGITVTAGLARDPVDRSPFERCIDLELRGEPVPGVHLTKPMMRTAVPRIDTDALEARPAIPDAMELFVLMKRCLAQGNEPPHETTAHYEAMVRGEAVLVEKAVVKSDGLTEIERHCIELKLERRVAFDDASQPSWQHIALDLKTNEDGHQLSTAQASAGDD